MEIGIIALVLLFLGGYCGYRSDKKKWNNGVCRENGVKWVHFDTASDGSDGYKAREHYCWISWPVDKNYVHPNRPSAPSVIIGTETI